MKLTILGSGTPVIDLSRHGTSLLLEIGQELIMIDCGWGSAEQLVRAGYKPQQIDHIFITHPHPDHVTYLPTIMQGIYVSGLYFPETLRTKPLGLHGYRGFIYAFHTLRRLMEPDTGSESYDITIDEIVSERRPLGNFVVESIPTGHNVGPYPGNAYRFEHEGKVFAFSGDSGNGTHLVRLARDADVAVLEAGVHLEQFKEQGPRPYHLSAFEAGQIARDAGVKHLMLTHIYNVDKDEDLIAAARENFAGQITVAQDLMQIEV